MQTLNLPTCELKIRDQKGIAQIFDFLRRRYLRLTPEDGYDNTSPIILWSTKIFPLPYLPTR